MSLKISQETFLEKFKRVYPEGQITITEWNGYTGKVKFLCDVCGETHSLQDARQILNKKQYCQKNAANNVKWDKSSYNERINRFHGENIEIIEYNGLSNPIKYKCPRCQKEKTCNPARTLITKLSLCDECYGIEKNIVEKKVRQLFEESKDYELIAWRGANKKLTEKCLKCGNVYDRYPCNVLQCFNSCPRCDNGGDKQKLDVEEIQRRIDKDFGENQYVIIDYKGQLRKDNKIKCLNCGLIFNIQLSYFTQGTRGCPKCKRFKSKGEQKIQKFLEENNIAFEAQKRFKDCNMGMSSFDFCAYNPNGQMFLIEVNGEQHYKDIQRLGGLADNQRRDKIKADYCTERNIPLIIIPYDKMTDNDINNFLLPLKGSTTIPEGSKK